MEWDFKWVFDGKKKRKREYNFNVESWTRSSEICQELAISELIIASALSFSLLFDTGPVSLK